MVDNLWTSLDSKIYSLKVDSICEKEGISHLEANECYTIIQLNHELNLHK